MSTWTKQGTKEQIARNKEIERELREEKRKLDKEVKILLLGK